MDKLESVNSDRTAASEYWDEDIVSESSESDDEREEGVPRLEAVDFDACLHRDYAVSAWLLYRPIAQADKSPSVYWKTRTRKKINMSHRKK
jgi:hypothetical protein